MLGVMRTRLKILYIKIVSTLLKLFWVIPLKKKTVLFLSFDGKQFSDSPKAIYDDLKRKRNDYRLIWAFISPNSIKCSKELNYVKKSSFRYYYTFCTSKFIIVNDFFDTYLPVRKSQVLINTWHGGGWFKKVGFTDNRTTEYDKFFFDYQCKKHTYFVASSEYFIETVLRDSFGYKGLILRSGMPRNAIFFKENHHLKESVRSVFGAQKDTLIVLYAPTFRSYEISPNLELDLNHLKSCLEAKFKKDVIILFRAHHLIDRFPIDLSSIIDVTSFPDMQQLLLACDVLVSDYSSCMWDAAIQDKLVIVYAPDAHRYIDNRGFFLDISEWPFLLAFNNEELEFCIQAYDNTEYLERLHKLVNESISYEGEHAVDAVLDVITN